MGGPKGSPRTELDRLDPEIAATDQEIDDLVYVLYGIADEERRIVEGTWRGGPFTTAIPPDRIDSGAGYRGAAHR